MKNLCSSLFEQIKKLLYQMVTSFLDAFGNALLLFFNAIFFYKFVYNYLSDCINFTVKTIKIIRIL
jgi:hypothetical protein